MEKFNIKNKGADIGQQNIGDNNTNTYNSAGSNFKEVTELLELVKNNLSQIGSDNSMKDISEIENELTKSTVNKKTIAKKLGDLLIGITSGCIANGLPGILSKISDVINTLNH